MLLLAACACSGCHLPSLLCVLLYSALLCFPCCFTTGSMRMQRLPPAHLCFTYCSTLLYSALRTALLAAATLLYVLLYYWQHAHGAVATCRLDGRASRKRSQWRMRAAAAPPATAKKRGGGKDKKEGNKEKESNLSLSRSLARFLFLFLSLSLSLCLSHSFSYLSLSPPLSLSLSLSLSRSLACSPSLSTWSCGIARSLRIGSEFFSSARLHA